MKQPQLRWAFAVLISSMLALHVRADSITNNFNTSADFLANGVVGTMWDGVYLGAGDIFGGDNAGDVGVTLQANETAFPGFLAVQDSKTDWAGTGDDGFFLFKVVAGDFDASVGNAPPFANPGFHFGGLMARAYTASGQHRGSPYNGAENWQNVMRFQEFSIDVDIRYATNGVDRDGYVNVPGVDTDTTTSRYFRITRVGDVFSFYTKTNQSDAWALHGSLSRPDLTGVPMQVGIADTTFGSTTPTTYFTDFELSGTNVTASVVSPANPTGLSASPSGSTVTFSWTPGAGSSGSILVLRNNNPNILGQKPINGYTYNAITNFGGGDDIGGGIYTVFAGAGGTATISGLGSTNQNYSVAVYSYSGSGSSIVYGTTPATNSTTGTGIPQGINFTISPTNGVPVGGVGIPHVVIFDNIGNTDVVDSASITWSSGNSGILTVSPDGTINGVAIGAAQVIATFEGFNVTNSVTVHAPAYTDNFSVSHDYRTVGLPGSTWDGLYLSGSDIPNASFGPPLANVSVFNANTTSNNVLSITAANSAWQGGGDNGPFLFKVVPGDFQAAVHITSYSIVNYEFVGLQARAFNLTNNASPSGPGFSENFVDWLRFDEFGVTTATFNTVNGGNTETDQNDTENADYWLLMQRVNSTNFYFFKKANLTDPWMFQPSETIMRSDLTNALQVGMVQSMFTANAGSVQFDSFSLDAANISGGVPPSATTGLGIVMDSSFTQATLTWTAGTNSDGSPSTSLVVMRAGGPVSAQPTFGLISGANSVFGLGTDLGGGNFIVFRAVGNTVTVTGLTPGVSYSATVYGYSGSGNTKSFNIIGSSSSTTPPVVFTSITASMPGKGIPVGGVGLPKVIGQIQGAGTLDISTSTEITSGDTNIAAATTGVISGLAVGTETNTLSFTSGANVLTTTLVTTVRPPSYTDNFGAAHNYLSDGITNTTWDGVFAQPGAMPGTHYVSDALAAISAADAGITSNNVLNVTSENVGWEGAQNDGFFLFKKVTGDFQASVHISYLNSSFLYDGGSMVGFNNPGLLARAYSTNDAPFNPNTGSETWVSFTRFDLFGFGTYARRTLNNGTLQNTQPGGFNGANTTSDTNLWLLIVRQNSTNFSFYQRRLATDPWAPTPSGTTYSLTNFANQPLEIGLLACGFNSGAPVTVGFDSFMLDTVSTSPTLNASALGGNLTLSWLTNGTYSLQYTLKLAPPTWLPVGGALNSAGGTNSMTVPVTNPATFFRLIQ